MNDFTKEELEELRYCVTFTHGDANGLADKIQSLIDNYCEHKNNVWPLYTSTGDIPVAGMCYECNCAVDRSFINE
jgi:hypothetical protein